MRATIAALAVGLAGPALAAPCGGEFNDFVAEMKAEALAAGADPATVDRFFADVRQDPRVLKADRAQTVFQKPFLDFSKSLISKNRMTTGAAKSAEFDDVFTQAQSQFGVPRGILLAFWAFETDFGQVQGDFNTVNALVTLGHDCRRPELFQPQILAAVTLTERGIIDPATTTGAWAGEIGMVQMLPGDIIADAMDGDGDGKISLKTSPPDALLSAAKKLQALGWRPGEPWLQEITLPEAFDWSLTGSTRPSRWTAGPSWVQRPSTARFRQAICAPRSCCRRAERPGLSGLSQLQRAVQLEPELRLRDDRRLFRDTARGGGPLYGDQAGGRAVARADGRVAAEAAARGHDVARSTASSGRGRGRRSRPNRCGSDCPPMPGRHPPCSTRSSMARWGVCATVRAPADQVLAFVAHHLDLGADRIWLHFDDPDDPALVLAAPLPRVTAVACDDAYWRTSWGGAPTRIRTGNPATYSVSTGWPKSTGWRIWTMTSSFCPRVPWPSCSARSRPACRLSAPRRSRP